VFEICDAGFPASLRTSLNASGEAVERALIIRIGEQIKGWCGPVGSVWRHVVELEMYGPGALDLLEPVDRSYRENVGIDRFFLRYFGPQLEELVIPLIGGEGTRVVGGRGEASGAVAHILEGGSPHS